MKRINKNRENGYSLVEIVFAIALLGILSLTVGGILTIGVNSYSFIVAHSVMTRESQNAMRIMSDKISMINPQGINRANKRRFYFLNMQGEVIQFEYRRSRGYLRYRILGKENWRTILNNIKRNQFSFTYLKGDGNTWSSLDDLKRVRISFTLELGGESMNLDNEIYVRNH